MNFLPSKKWAIAVFAFVIIITLGLIIVSRYQGDGTKNNPSGLNAEPGALSEAIAQKDTDGDGLRDWEENLWHTNLNNSDTDHDGTPDGEEVQAGRDPLVKGPKDALLKSAQKSNSFGENGEKTNATDTLAQNVFGNYLSLRQSGVVIDANTSAAIVEAALKNFSDYPAGKTYEMKDISISNDESIEAVRRYGNLLGESIIRDGKPNVDNEMITLYYALETNDAKKLNDLSVIVKSYQKIIGDFLKMPVPAGAARAHLALINSASRIAAEIDAMRLTFSDPVTAIAALRDYQSDGKKLAAAQDTVRFYIQNHGVIFSAREPGAQFFRTAKLP